LTAVIVKASHGHQGAERAAQWRAAAAAAVELYGDHPALAWSDLAAEVATEVALLRATQQQLATHAAVREEAYRWVDVGQFARSLPGVAEVSAPALVAAIGQADRFPSGSHFKSFAGLAPKASETDETDRKGQPMSKPGNKPDTRRASAHEATFPTHDRESHGIGRQTSSLLTRDPR
jgi:transposase